MSIIDNVGYDFPKGSDPFKDLKVMDLPKNPKFNRKCSNCKGHGQWYLNFDFPVEGNPHYLRKCRACHGLGWLKEIPAPHEHNWKFEKNLGRCFNRYVCTICGAKDDVDSGD